MHPLLLLHPAGCILPLVVCALLQYLRSYPAVFRLPGRDIWDSPKMSLASGNVSLLEKSVPCFHPNSFVAGLARTNLVFDYSRAASSLSFGLHGPRSTCSSFR